MDREVAVRDLDARDRDGEVLRLRAELAAERHVTEQLARIGTVLAAERDPDRVVQRLTDEATTLVRAQFGAFFYNVTNDRGESYTLYTLSGVPREAFSKFPMPRNTKVFAPTFAGDGVVRSDDITKDPRYGQNAPHRGMPEGHLPVRSYLAMPVRSQRGEVLGGLFFGHAETGVFKDRDERALGAIASIAASVLDGTRALRTLQETAEALRRSEARYRLVSESTEEGVWYWDCVTNAVEWNDRLLELMGVTRDAWGGRFEDWFDRVHPDDQEALANALRAHLERREPYRVERFRLRHASGDYRFCTTTGQAEWDANGRPLRMAGAFRDITEKVLADEALRQLNATLERRVEERTAELLEVNRELEAFSYTVSHDLRAPIRHVSGFVDLLRESAGGTLDERSRRYLDTIKGAATRMGQLIDGLLAFSRLGRTELAKRRVRLDEIVRSVVDELRLDLRGRTVAIEVGELPEVDADSTMLRLVIANLVDNAVKYTSQTAEAKITVRAERTPREVVVHVEDNGVGFDMECLPKLFGVFQRLHADAEFEGTGIGLATVRRIVARHGGRTWAEGRPGEGATFSFSLPEAR